MKILVTGAAGFIGSHVVHELLSRGHVVHALARPGASLDRLKGVEGNVAICSVDLADTEKVADALADVAPDAVLHLAWYAEPGAYLSDFARNLSSLENSLRLVRLLLDGPTVRLVLAGTCLEAIPPGPGTKEPIYAVTKKIIHDIALRSMDKDLSAACAHVFSVFGPGENERRAVPSVIRSLLRGETVKVSPGDQLRDYLHVEDVANALVTILESDVAEGIDICSSSPRTLRAVFEEIGRSTERPDLILWGSLPIEAGHDFDAVGDAAALHALGWRPRYSLAEGIDDTVRWWRTQEPSA